MVRVNFSMGSYHDYVDCDVVPMQACSLLLGRPWQYDTDCVHHGRNNQYSFMLKGKKIVMHPMTPEQIVKDELARASREKNQENAKSENQIVAKEFEQHKKKEHKSTHVKKIGRAHV